MLCRISGEYIKDGYTQIDNRFLLRYLPVCDPVDLKVYLYGLTLAALKEREENTLERIALALKLTEERVAQAFSYWEEQGLVAMTKSLPLEITFLSVKNPSTHTVKYKSKALSEFTNELSRLFPEKIFYENELTKYFDLISFYKMEIGAILLIIQYCIGLGKQSTPYILAVAENWAKQGLITEQKVNSHIAKLEANSEAVKMIFSVLGVKREGELEDRQFVDKWTGYGYTLDAILTAGRALKKRGGMQRLDKFIDELKEAGAFSCEEIADYVKNADKLRELSISILKNLGGSYANADTVTEAYVIPWLAKGFSDSALLSIASFCFLRGLSSLDAMNQMLAKFHKLNLLDEGAITAYLGRQMAIDGKIQGVFAACSHTGLITNRDREFYRVWADEWGFDDECILYAATLADKKPYPMSKINRSLSLCYKKGALTLGEVKKELSIESVGKNAAAAVYTEDDLKNVLIRMEDLEL